MTKHDEVTPMSDADIARLDLYSRPKDDLYRRLLARLDNLRFSGRPFRNDDEIEESTSTSTWTCDPCLRSDHSGHGGTTWPHCAVRSVMARRLGDAPLLCTCVLPASMHGVWVCTPCLVGDHSNHNGPNSSHCVSYQTNVPAEVRCTCRTIYLKRRPLTWTFIGVGPRGFVYEEHGQVSYADGNTVDRAAVVKLDPRHLKGLANLTEQRCAGDDLVRRRAEYLLFMLTERSHDKDGTT